MLSKNQLKDGKMGKPPKKEIICFCNNVPRDVIEKAIREGAQTLNEIYDITTAGIGPCGGSCRRKIGPMLEHYLAHGKFQDEETEKPEVQRKKNPYGI